MDGIADLRHATSGRGVTTEGLRKLSAYNGSLPAEFNHPRFVIVAGSDVAFGLSRMFATFSEKLGSDYSIVRNMDEACARLGLSPDAWKADEGWVVVDDS